MLGMSRLLVLLRHAKSDWSRPVGDDARPLAGRGKRQAAEAGVWLAENGPALDLAVVSTARRAQDTWARASAQLAAPPPQRDEDAAYTFDGVDLLEIVRALEDDDTLSAVVLVGHNPAMAELVHLLTGESVGMPTSALAVIELPAWTAPGRLVMHGRPPA